MAKIVNFIQLSSHTPIFFMGVFHFFVFFLQITSINHIPLQ